MFPNVKILMGHSFGFWTRGLVLMGPGLLAPTFRSQSLGPQAFDIWAHKHFETWAHKNFGICAHGSVPLPPYREIRFWVIL